MKHIFQSQDKRGNDASDFPGFPFKIVAPGKAWIWIHVVPHASCNKLSEITQEVDGQGQSRPYLKVMTTQPAEDGQANEGVISFLSKWFKISKSSFSIEKGHQCRKKLLSISSSEDKLEKASQKIQEFFKIAQAAKAARKD